MERSVRAVRSNRVHAVHLAAALNLLERRRRVDGV